MKFLDQDGIAYYWNKIKTYITNSLNLKMNLVSNPSNNKLVVSNENGQVIITETDLDQLVFDVEAGKEAFMLYDINQTINIQIPSVTTSVNNTAIPNIDVTLNDTMAAKWAVAGLVKYEVYNGSTRLNVMPICTFSMDGQKTLRVRMMCAGGASQAATKIQGAVLLKHR